MRVRQPLHAAAWWTWALCLAAAASRTTNPLLLGLLLAVAGVVVAARRSDEPWGGSFRVFLRLALVVVAIRTVFHLVLGTGVGTTVLVELPEVTLPDWAQGIRLGGPVTAEGLVLALTDALRLAVMLTLIGAANALASPRRLLRSLPAALYEVSVAVVVAMTLAPQLVERAQRVRRARQLRGEDPRRLRAVRSVVVPVLEGALDASIHLAASMDARGYGRIGERSPAQRRAGAALLVASLLGLCLGAYGVLAAAEAGARSWVLLAGGVVLAAAGLRLGARRVVRTRYRPDRWGVAEAVVVASGLAALVGVEVARAVDGSALVVPVAPLTWPSLPIAAAVGALVALAPAVAAPPPVPRAPVRPEPDGGDDRRDPPMPHRAPDASTVALPPDVAPAEVPA